MVKGPAPKFWNFIVFEVVAETWNKPPSESLALFVKKFESTTVTVAVVAELGMYRIEAEVSASFVLKLH